MKQFVLGVLAIGFSSLSIAQSFNSAETPYQTIFSWRSQSRPVVFSELAQKAILGKCFNISTPNKGGNNILVAGTKKIDDDRGPAFPGFIERKAMIFVSEPARTSEVLRNLNSNWASGTFVIPSDSSLVHVTQGGMDGEVRKIGDYFLTLFYVSADITCTRDIQNLCKKGEVVRKGTAYEACYFYQEANP